MSTPSRPSLIWCVALLFPLLAITCQSFWIDEAITGNAVRQSTLAGCWHSLRAINGSDLQMPFYMLYAFAWQKLFGASELSLRLVNYPFFILGQIAGARIWPDRRKGYLFILLAGCSSFLWFYLNEARPYAIEFGLSCVLVYFISAFSRDQVTRRSQYWAFAFTLLALSGMNMLGVAWVGMSMAIATFFLVRYHRRPALLPALFCFTALALLGCYYLWTLAGGARATVVASKAILGVAFLLYELLGFTGLGPGRLDIRVHGLSSFLPFLAPLFLFALLLLIIFGRALRLMARSPERKLLWATAVYALPPIGFLVLAGLFTNFRLLGRHIMPALPVVFVFLAIGIWSLWNSKARFARHLVAGFWLLSVLACLGVRFLPWHAKDDYRDAAALAKQFIARHQLVWWCASADGAAYYRLDLKSESKSLVPAACDVRNLSGARITPLPSPDLVLLSKPDIFDGQGAIEQMLQERKFTLRETLPGFTVWTKRSEP